jgi:hypothetical protein
VAQWTGSTGAFPGGFFGLWSGTNGTGGIGVLSDSGNANWNGGGIQNISHNGGALAISPFPLIEQPTILRWTGSGTRVGYRISGDRDNVAASRGWRGRVGELIMFTTTLTDDQRRSMVVALAQKWGVRL